MKTKKGRSNVANVAATLVALVVVCLGGIAWWGIRAKQDYEAALEEAKAAGLATSSWDFQSMMPVADNAAATYEVLAAREPIPVGTYDSASKRFPTADSRNATLWFLRSLSELESAATMSRCRFDHRWHKGGTPLSVNLSQMKDMVKALGVAAHHFADELDWDMMIRCLRLQRSVAAHLSDDLPVMSYLTGASAVGICCRTQTDIAWQLRENASALKMLEDFVEQPAQVPDRKQVLHEYAYEAASLPETLSTLPDPATNPYFMGSTEERFQILIASKMPFARYRAATANLRKITALFLAKPRSSEETRNAWGSRPRLGDSMSQSLSKYGCDWLDVVSDKQPQMETYNKLARIAIRLLLTRKRTGKFPSALPDWGDLTHDPYNDKPFVFRTTKDGFVISSVGEDRQDDTLKQSNHDQRLTFDGTRLH